MRSLYALALCCAVLLAASRAAAQNPSVRFRASYPYGLLHFLQACEGLRSTDAALADLIEREGLLTRDTAFARLVTRWRAIRKDYSYLREQYPEQRVRSRSGQVGDLLVSAAVQSDDLAGFRNRSIGVLPNADHHEFFAVLEAARPTYDRLVWTPGAATLAAQIDTLNRYAPRISTLFGRLNRFYGTDWPADIPFIVAPYPIPGRRGGTHATPHNNILCMGLLNGDRDWDGMAGVVLHEMCHSLYNEQPDAVQSRLERYFLSDTSRYAPLAYSFFDEGMATACGNGWAREALNGAPDTGAWYANRYINGFGHALYPVVKEYLAHDRAMDSAFVREAIRRFTQAFPQAPYEYDLLLNNLSLYTDAPDGAAQAEVLRTIRKHFKLSSYSASTPILEPTSLDLLEHSPATQLVVVRPDATAGLTKLKALFPPLAAMLRGTPEGTSWIASFYDAAKRPVIVACVAGTANLDAALKILDQQVAMQPTGFYKTL